VGAPLVRDFVMLAGADLTSSSTTAGGVLVTSHYRSEDRAAGLQGLDIAARALSQFARRFGPYPYVRFDLVEAPLVGGAGGVEFSGLATVASMFYSAGGTGGLGALLPLGSMREFVTAHEVAHQWWHVLVGSDSRSSPYTDESLTQYSAMLYFEDRYGKERARHEGEMNAKMNFQLMRLLGHADGRVEGPVSSFASSLEYAGLVYGKGPYFYEALRKLVGDASFFQSLRTYVARYQFRIAPPSALADLMTGGPKPEEARVLASRWLREAHGDQDLGSVALPGMAGLLGHGKTPDLNQLMEELMKELDSGALP